MILYDMQDFGGLEELAVAMAVGLQQQGCQTSVLSTAWVPPDNQYLCSLRENNVPFVQLPKWLSQPASDWPTKEKILAWTLWSFSPLTYLLAGILFVLKKRTWRRSLTSARGWLGGKLIGLIGPDWRKPLIRLFLNWWRFRWRPDVLHIHGYTSSFTGNLLFVIEWAHAKGIPTVYEEHQTPDPQFNWWRDFQKSVNKASIVLAVSEKSAQALREVCGVTQPIVVVSPIVADPIASGWQMDAQPQPPDAPLSVTTLARLYFAKGLTYLLEAIARVRTTHPTTQFKVYGDGPLRQELLAYAAQLGLDGSQIFVGTFTHPELPLIMTRTDIFVMSSILEGQPLAVVEAMAYGRPIVATSVGGISEMIKDGVNGLLCKPGDPEDLAQKICALIENPALRRILGRAARNSYEQGPFLPISNCRQLVSIYHNALRPEHLNDGHEQIHKTIANRFLCT
jgi:glycosyltransferase involved in cell wall biosynthesis